MATRASLVVLVALLGWGCGNDFFPASLVNRTRIVGARLSVDGDDTRAWPVPGETVSLDYYVLRADPDEGLSAGLFGCAVATNRSGAPGCAGPPFASFPPSAPSLAPLHFEMTIPDRALLGDASTVLLALATCAGGGMPSVAEGASVVTCDGPGRAELTSLTFSLAPTAELANHHPELDDGVYEIDGMAWDAPPTSVPETGCAAVAGDASFPTITIPSMGEHVVPITFTATDDDREPYATRDGTGAMVMRREILQFSHYLTAGTFERQFSSIDDATTPANASDIEWTVPPSAEVPVTGLTVRFWWVVRDLRGGFDLLDRVACVVVGD